MSIIIILKTVHVLAAVFFLGVGFGSFWYKLRADRSGDVQVIVWCQRNIVLADWLFTIPSAVVLPISGIWLAQLYGMPLTTPWIAWGIGAFSVAGITWLPAAWLQIKMRALANEAAAASRAPAPAFMRYHRIWLALGVPSFMAALIAVWVMVSKAPPF